MQAIARTFPGVSLIFSITLDRILIPLAVVVGLAGGAMIGTELAKLQAPVDPYVH